MKWGVLGSLILVGSVVVYGILAYDLENKKINWSVFISAMILFPKYFLKAALDRIKREKGKRKCRLFSPHWVQIVGETIFFFPTLFLIVYMELVIEYQELKESNQLEAVLQGLKQESKTEAQEIKKELRSQFFHTKLA